MKNAIFRISLAAGAALTAVTLAACGGGGDGGSGATGTLSVAMTDAPACGFDAVNVTVSKVRVHQSAAATESDGGWTDITLNPARKIDLLKLNNGVLEALGETPLGTGHYNQLRLVLDPNTGNGLANTVLASGSLVEQSLDTPSAVQSGIKLVSAFEVGAGQRTDLVLDFDACKSVVTKGNGKYALKPVVNIVPAGLNGITGFISPGLLASHVTVTAQQGGQVIAATAPSATTGAFFLARLAPGNYDVAITADSSAASVIAAVPVASATSTTVVSTAAAPITLAASPQGAISGTVTLQPASAGAVAYLDAKQSFAGGPTVTIRSRGTDIASGAYTVDNLPLAAPQLAQYSASLPLVFSAQAGTTPGTGKYRVDAISAFYFSQQVAAIDISAANQSGVNFTLLAP